MARSVVAVLALAVVVVAAAWGCGGGGGEGGEGDAGATAGAPAGARTAGARAAGADGDALAIRDLAERYLAAFFRGDGDAACGMLSEGARRRLLTDPSAAAWGDTCAERMEAGARLARAYYGSAPRIDIRDLRIAGDRATGVSVAGGRSEDILFEREGGEWRIGPDR